MTQRMPITRAALCRRIYNGLHGLVHACNIFIETVLDKASVSGFVEQRPCWSVMVIMLTSQRVKTHYLKDPFTKACIGDHGVYACCHR